MQGDCCVLSDLEGTFEKNVLVQTHFLLHKVSRRLALETGDGFNHHFASSWGENYLSLSSSGRGGCAEVRREGAESASSSSVLDL